MLPSHTVSRNAVSSSTCLAAASPSRNAWPTCSARICSSPPASSRMREAPPPASLPRARKRDRRTGGQGFDAAVFAAGAARTPVVDGHVPALGGASGASVMDLAVQDDARADAGAEGGVEDVGVPSSRAPQDFGESGGVGVVIHLRGDTEDALGLGGQREAAPARHVRRIEHDAGSGIQGPGRAQADAGDRAARFRRQGEDRLDGVYDGREAGGGIAGRDHGHARLVRNLTGGIYQSGSHFGSANIDANDHGFNRIIPLDPKIAASSPVPPCKSGRKELY